MLMLGVNTAVSRRILGSSYPMYVNDVNDQSDGSSINLWHKVTPVPDAMS